tara:strand:+ start:749 stop:1066 length:318 start_codon:yes stop_codon:yes gene_type:complete
MKMSDLHIEQMERDESPSTIKIDKGVPITYCPRSHLGGVLSSDEKKMIQSMEVGDSFIAPDHMIQTPKGSKYVQLKGAVRRQFTSLNRECTSRFSKEGLRVWRIQ